MGIKNVTVEIRKIESNSMGKKQKKEKKEVESERSNKMILGGVITAIASIALLIYIVSSKILYLS